VYFVMELLEGQSLRDRLTAFGPMPIDEVVACARQIIDALAAAHRMGIIHRDLKPDNIFLVPDTQLPGGFRSKLFDFGVAKLLGEKQAQVGHKTIDGAVVGTPFYMSPEQALCQDVTAAADIYAMGVVLYEMVTGAVPFRSEQLVILLNAILKQPAPPASRARPDTPPWLDRLILRCLEKDPEARPRSMEEMGAILTAGAAELSGNDTALGATMMAPVTMAPVSVPQVVGPRTTVPRQPTASGQTVAAAPAPEHSATAVPRQTAIRPGGMARPSEAPGVVQRLRAYLDTRRVQRLAVPLLVLTAGIVVASIFFSSKADLPVTEIVPEVAMPVSTSPAHASIHLNSDPSGAEVLRLGDNRQLGTTPMVDIRPADGRQVNYRFHLAGYTDVQMPFQVTSSGMFEITATLSPLERRPESGGRTPASSGRRTGHGRDKGHVAAPAPVEAPLAVPAPQPRQALPQPSMPPPSMPALGERNPVRRLGR